MRTSKSIQVPLSPPSRLSRLHSHSVQRKCSKCSEQEDSESARKLPLQAKVAVSAPGDRHEQEADAMADTVMRSPAPALGDAQPAPRRPGSAGPNGAGAPLHHDDRVFFESRFGFDFANVRVHADARAAEATRTLGARAFTLGSNVVFGSGEYRPGTSRGRHLLAHELTHVVQQASGASVQIQRTLRVENPNVALSGAPPKENWQEVSDYIAALSSGFNVVSSGAITPTAGTCTAPARTTDQCLCDLHTSSNDWTILIDDIAWPHTEDATFRVTVHSTRSGVAFGAWGGGANAGQRIEQDNSRVLGHELCGHAALMERGTHPATNLNIVGGRLMGRPSHDPTVAVENTVAQEMVPGAPVRGSFADPHHGESLARITASDYPSAQAAVSSLSPAMQARLDHVKALMDADALLRADIVGHADHSGSNQAAISRARAQGVRTHLQGLGLPASRFLAVQGNGAADCPAAPLDNPACRSVDIFMFIFQGASLRNP